jgi:type IV secretory pathway VirB3-like protein
VTGQRRVHLALVKRRMLAGLPEGTTKPFWIATAGIASGLHELWVVPIALALHVALALLHRKDPHFLDVVRRELFQPRRLNP